MGGGHTQVIQQGILDLIQTLLGGLVGCGRGVEGWLLRGIELSSAAGVSDCQLRGDYPLTLVKPNQGVRKMAEAT